MQQPSPPKVKCDTTAPFLHAVCAKKNTPSVTVTIKLSNECPRVEGNFNRDTASFTSDDGQIYKSAQAWGFAMNDRYIKSNNLDRQSKISVRSRLGIQPENLPIDQYPFDKTTEQIMVSLYVAYFI